jgi:molecular chaperone DnaJ
MTRDYYAVLGVATAASTAQIRRAYQRLARQYSPDVNLWQQEVLGVFEEIAEAYRVLGDPMARAVYDREPTAPSAKPSREGVGAPRPSGRRGDDLHLPVELAFQQALSGVTADLLADRLSPCAECGASGAAPGSVRVTCSYCGGLGTVWSAQGAPRPEACPVCKGSGARALDPCPGCRGRGVRTARAVVGVTLPPGVDTGAQIRVEGEGHCGPYAGPRGDLIVVARVHEDPEFIRKGDNLYREVWLGIVEAVLGTRFPVRGVDGLVDLVVPPGTQSGQVLRLRGRGMPRLSGGGRGDLYVTARVEIPRGLDARTQELFREIGRLLPPAPRGTTDPRGTSDPRGTTDRTGRP